MSLEQKRLGAVNHLPLVVERANRCLQRIAGGSEGRVERDGAIGERGYRRLHEGVEGARPELDGEGPAVAFEEAGEPAAHNAEDPRRAARAGCLARLYHEVYARMGEGLRSVGLAATEVPGDDPVVLHEAPQVRRWRMEGQAKP